jgi:hypothetical protein
MNKIGIGQVLAEIRVTHLDGVPRRFELKWVTKEGKLCTGQMQADYKHDKTAKPTTKPRDKPQYNLKEKAHLLLWNHTVQQYASVNIHLIISYNGRPVFY